MKKSLIFADLGIETLSIFKFILYLRLSGNSLLSIVKYAFISSTDIIRFLSVFWVLEMSTRKHDPGNFNPATLTRQRYPGNVNPLNLQQQAVPPLLCQLANIVFRQPANKNDAGYRFKGPRTQGPFKMNTKAYGNVWSLLAPFGSLMASGYPIFGPRVPQG